MRLLPAIPLERRTRYPASFPTAAQPWGTVRLSAPHTRARARCQPEVSLSQTAPLTGATAQSLHETLGVSLQLVALVRTRLLFAEDDVDEMHARQDEINRAPAFTPAGGGERVKGRAIQG
jgi:hypothetical protein